MTDQQATTKPAPTTTQTTPQNTTGRARKGAHGPTKAEVLALAQRTQERLDRLVGWLSTPGPDGLTPLDRQAEHEAHVYGDRSESDGRGGGTPDPVGNAALQMHPKPLSQTRERFEAMCGELYDLELIAIEHRPPEPNPKRDLTWSNEDPGCQPCARLGHWSPVYRTGTVGGALSYAMRLCQWDYRHVMATGKLAPEAIRKQYLAGKEPVVRTNGTAV